MSDSASLDTAYEPRRVRLLARRVELSIDTLSACSCDDPVAADAMRTIRLTRRNLEEQWMPLLREIERSTAMTQWARTLPDWVFGGSGSGPWFRLAHRLGAVRQVDPAAERLITTLYQRPWFDDIGSMVHATTVTTQMRELLDDPQACLDVLEDPTAVFMLAEWDLLDDDLVQAFVTAGLRDAVVAENDRLNDGYSVLRDLTRYANGALDGGFRPGMARGVAVSMRAYVPTLAPAIRAEANYPVRVTDEEHGVAMTIGTYDDLRDLMGALLRDRAAQVELGEVVAGYTAYTAAELGSDVTAPGAFSAVAEFADLIADSAGSEQAELVAAAAAVAARRRAIGEGIGTGVDVVLSATGAGAPTKALSAAAIALATEFVARVDPEELPGRPIAEQTAEFILISTVAVLVDEPGHRGELGVDDISTADWAHIADQLDQVRAADTATARTERFIDLQSWATDHAPALAGVLLTVRSSAAFHELTEDRERGDPDD